MKRRAVVLGATAAVGIVAGASTAVWRSRHAGAADDNVAVDIWSLTFSGVDGAATPMSGLRGKALLVNFWATWCVPCAIEMPLLDAFARKSPALGWNVLAVAIDSADPVRRFLAERTLRLPVVLGGADGLDLSRSLGNNVGALPFTVAFAAGGEPLHRKLGAIDRALLTKWTGIA